jgi:hypothetical protein
MFVKRYKGDKTHEWPAKEFSHAVGGTLCALAVRLAYEKLNPVLEGADPASVPYWQLPSGTPVTRAKLQSFLQTHMKQQGAPEKLYKPHSLRKGGATALLAAGVPLPQIQLMARWVSPNEHDSALRFVNEGAVGLCFHATRLVQLGGMLSLDVVSEEKRFWTAYTTRPG